MNFDERLRKAREYSHKSQRLFAEMVGCSLSAWQSYESGASVPGGRVLEQLCLLGYNGDWLLTGLGAMMKVPEPAPEPVVPVRVAEEPVPYVTSLQRISDEEERQLISRLSLGSIGLLAARGRLTHAWRLLRLLITAWPEPLNLDQLRLALQADEPNLTTARITAELTILERKGWITSVGPASSPGFRASGPSLALSARELEDRHQAALIAVECLLKEILPSACAEDARGHLLSAQLEVPTGEGESLVRELWTLVQKRCERAGQTHGREQVSVVFGAGVL